MAIVHGVIEVCNRGAVVGRTELSFVPFRC